MNYYLHKQYLETKTKFSKLSSRLSRSQERGEFYLMSAHKQKTLVSRIKKLWEKLRILEIQLKIASAGACLALMMMATNANAQNFVLKPDKNPLPPDEIVLPESSIYAPQFVDYDGDGDMDLFTHQDDSYLLHFFEYKETGVQTKYFENTEKTFSFMNPDKDIQLPFFVDIDLDGDMDVVSLLYVDSTETISYELARNIGTKQVPEYEKFPLPDLAPTGYIVWPSFVDIDDDGDMDVFFVGISYYGEDDKLQYFENTSTDVIQFTQKTGDENPLDILNLPVYKETYVIGLVFSDIDMDGDFDMAFAEAYSGNIFFFQNSGTKDLADFEDKSNIGYFTGINTGEYGRINLIDWDNDGDDDLFTHEYYASITKYYENTGPLGIKTLIRFQLNLLTFILIRRLMN